MLIIQLIEDFHPPIFVVLAFEKLCELITFDQFLDWFAVNRVALVVIEIVPVFWDVTSTNFHFFVRRIV